ncbi:TPA: hypothetical protein RQK47_003569, partial [Vibrio vulnificus]|nr:hypothetical protein [Vibrio vulnificus]ELK8329679.1 hypothetical protein [Vibrio vulnificus]ELN6898383.1 hypothetical protein [Vibrio vulnificus]ELU0082899.1 hypothetical protein [Vibrio vulnificus]ELV8714840.1 hypothetical protein [Vibrio vulnificus]
KSSNRDNQSQSENRENAPNKAKEKSQENSEQGNAQRQKKPSEQGEEQVKPSDKPAQERETEPKSVEAQQPAPKNADDPDFKKLESVENARDPAYLLKAQMLQQAQQKPAPDNKDKTW